MRHDENLREMLGSDCPRVAEIHHRALPDDFCSHLGRGFLRDVFYPHFLDQPDSIGLVAGEGSIDGFVVGAPGLGYYGRLFRRRWSGLLTAWIRTRVGRPSLFKSDLDVARVLLAPGAFQPGGRDVELLYIAVDPAAQGRSVGSQLTEGLLARLAGGSYDRCVVKTLASTPDTVRFYEANGFSVIAEQFGRVWLACPVPSPTSESEAHPHA